jgi:hypothetical protein
MKRRTFIKSATTMASSAILPTSVFGAAPLSPTLVARAEHMAGLWVETSAQMMKKAFSLDSQTAHALFQTLINRNVVSTPNVYGVARAVLPCYDNPVFAAKVNRLMAKANPNTPISTQASHRELKNMTQRMKQELAQKLDKYEDDFLEEDQK